MNDQALPLVSAVITTHKREPRVVERALKSIVDQTYSNMEVIVVDDSPSDYVLRNDVKQAVERYADRGVTYVAHDTCQGACVARNTGISYAKGEYIGFLDDDDEWFPEKIERLLAEFDSDSVALVYCDNVKINENTETTEREFHSVHSGLVFDELIKTNFIGSTSFPLLRMSALRSIGGFDPKQQSAQDYDVWLRLAERYEIRFVCEPLVTYYVHAGEQISKTSTKRIGGLELINEKNMDYLKRHSDAYWYRMIKMVPEYAKNGQYKKAWSHWLKAIVKKPFRVKENVRYFYYFLRIAFWGR